MRYKHLNRTSLIAAFLLITFISACNNTGQEEGTDVEMKQVEGVEMVEEEGVTAENTEGISPVLVEYIDIKNALVNDNFTEARRAIVDFENALEASDQLSEEQKAVLIQTAAQLAKAQDIATLRERFASLSRQLYQIVQANDLTEQTLYWQHCPMAMNGQGANWLSLEEKVQNPYMGQKMPGCGSVQEKL